MVTDTAGRPALRAHRMRQGVAQDCSVQDLLTDLAQFAICSDAASWYCAEAGRVLREALAEIDRLTQARADAEWLAQLTADERVTRAEADAQCPREHAGLETLIHKLGLRQPLLPDAELGQDVAFLAHVIEGLIADVQGFRQQVEEERALRAATERHVAASEDAYTCATDHAARLEAQVKLLTRRCVTHPEAERLDGCVECVAEEIAAARRKQEAAEARVEELRKDVAYHDECRPNRRQAEAALADAKATNDRLADEVAAHRATQVRMEAAEAQVEAERADRENYGPYFVRDLARVIGLPDDASMDAVRAQVEKLTRERNEAYEYLSRLFHWLAPQCVVSDNFLYLCTQIDNYIAGQHKRVEAAEVQVEDLTRELKEACRRAGNLQCAVIAETAKVAAVERRLAVLREYVRHKPDCASWKDWKWGAEPISGERIVVPASFDCTCGLAAALRREEPS